MGIASSGRFLVSETERRDSRSNMNIIVVSSVVEDTSNLGVWFHIKSTDEDGDNVVGILHDGKPDLTGFTQTRAGQVAEECSCNLGGTPLLCFFKQAPGQNIGCGDALVFVTYRKLDS